jgi:lipoate-protein ligase B
MVEHPHVFTVGKAVLDEIPSQIAGIHVVRIERGGRWTYHGPGQLVGYPILDLNTRGRDIHRFVWSLEEVLVRTLAQFNIMASRMEGRDKAGVWVGEKKIASIGAAVRNWTTFHGFALNVNTDMHYFSLIEPCGMPSSFVTSMKIMLNSQVNFNEVKDSLKHHFEDVFHVSLKTMDAQTFRNTELAQPPSFFKE